MSNILTAKPVVQELLSTLKQQVSQLQANGIIPTVAIIRVGSRPDDVAYENSIIKNCEKNGIVTQKYPCHENISMDAFIKVLHRLNQDKNTHGIMIFCPLPEQLDENTIKHIVDPQKDIDCINPLNLAKVFAGEEDGMLPCTPAAVIETIKNYGLNMQGANIVVIGRSLVVGKPLSMLLLKENATVTICHSKTKNMQDIAKKADILISAIGKARFIDDSYVTNNSIVIDVGINDDGEGKICGDVDYEAVKDKVQSITPVPGGVGSITTAILLKNVVEACERQVLHKEGGF